MTTQNLTTYTKNDPNGRLTVAAARVDFAGILKNEDCNLYYDFGANFFDGNFEHLLEIYIDSGTNWGRCYPWMLTNDIDDYYGLQGASKSALALLLTLVDGVYSIRMHELNSGTTYTDLFTCSVDTSYYLKIKRDESVGTYGTLYCYIYSDAERTNLLDTLELALHTSKKDFQYLFAINTYNDAGAQSLTGYAQNYDLQEPEVVPLTGTIAAQSGMEGELTGITHEETTVYGDAADGWMDKEAAPPYANAHDAPVADSAFDGTNDVVAGQQEWVWFTVTRGALYFYIPEIEGSIVAAKLVLRCNQKIATSGRAFAVVVQGGMPTYPHDPLVVGDFSKDHYSGDGGSIGDAAIVVGNDCEIMLNETGLGWITKGQWLKLCLRISHDINNSAPPDGGEYASFYSADYAIEAQRPRLVLTYQPGIELTGTIAAQSALTGALAVARKLAGAIAAQAGAQGALKVAWKLAGSSSSLASIEAVLKRTRTITGTTAGQSLVQGILGLIRDIAGTITAQSTVGGTLSKYGLIGESATHTTIEGTLKAEKKLIGEVLAQATIQADLARVRALAGTIAAQSSLAGEIIPFNWIDGIIAAISTIEGSLILERALAGEVAAQAGIEGYLSVPGGGQHQSQMFLVL